jgi:hypothetical protein
MPAKTPGAKKPKPNRDPYEPSEQYAAASAYF